MFDHVGEFEMSNVPGLRRFYRGGTKDFATVSRFYDLRDRVLSANKEHKDLLANNKSKEAAAFNKNYGDLLKLKGMTDKVDKALLAQRRLKDKAKKMTGTRKKQTLDKIEESRIKQMLSVLQKAHTLGINT